MEHIVQFAIGIDDGAIRKRIEENAEKQILQNIEQSIRNRLFDPGYHRLNATELDPLSQFSMRILNDFLEKHKYEIIDKAGEYLADKLVKTKAGKALIEKLAEES